MEKSNKKLEGKELHVQKRGGLQAVGEIREDGTSPPGQLLLFSDGGALGAAFT